MKSKIPLFLAIFPMLYYSSQGILTWWKLSTTDAEKISFQAPEPKCSPTICIYNYTYSSERKYLLAGHIVRSHKVFDSSGVEIFPTNHQKGNKQDTWQVMTSALNGEIPTVIGHNVKSLILVFDLEGSTNLEGDGEEKAKAYGAFYDKLTTMCYELIGGAVRKTMGDGVIVTANIDSTDKPKFLQDMVDVSSKAETIGKSVGGTGTRLAIHYGEYFLGLVGTKTSGTPDIIGRNIDVVCKLEGKMKDFNGDASPKISITAAALEALVGNDTASNFNSHEKVGQFLMFKTPAEFLDHCYTCLRKKRIA